MQTKLTLRMDDGVIRKAKRLARRRGTSVSRLVSEFISQTAMDTELDDVQAELTVSMIGVLHDTDIEGDRGSYHAHLEEKHL